MKSIRHLFCLLAIAAPLLLTSCSGDEGNDAPFTEEITPISLDELFSKAQQDLPYILRHVYSIENEQGEWVSKYENAAEEGIIGDIPPNIILKYLSEGLWFKGDGVYTSYHAKEGTFSFDENSRQELFYPHGDWKNPVQYYVRNSLSIDGENHLNLSSQYYQDMQKDGYSYVLEEVNGDRIIIRVELPGAMSGVRAVYHSSTQAPDYWMDFDTDQEVFDYFNSIIEKHKQ